jgi:Mg-chelatase subunit ChlD
MRPKFLIALMVLLLASVHSFAQGVITPRRHTKPQQTQGTENNLSPATRNSTANLADDASSNQLLPATLAVSAIKIKLKIVGQVAVVRVEHLFRNDTAEDLEGTYYFPVPEGASLLEFAVFDGVERRVGRVKEKEEARKAYTQASVQGDNPAILEMTKRGWFQSHIYPIAPHSDKRVEIIYSQVLSAKDSIIGFDYPLGQGYKKLKVPVGSVEVELDLSATSAINNVFSPTHPIDFNFDGERHVTGKLNTVGGDDAENFRLQYSLAEEDVSLSLLTYRKKGEDGHFLMMLSPKVDFDKRRISSKDVIFVIDVSGSMDGEKLQQAKEALRFGLKQTLKESDRFNIIAFESLIRTMTPTMLPATPSNISQALDFVDNLKVQGGTNINDALVTAMQMFEANGRPHNLVFLTDGEPSASISDPQQIAANVKAANRHRAHLFAFGVGSNVNNLLLEKLASDNRGADAKITDTAELNRTISGFFAKVAQPVLSDLHVDFGQLQVERTQPAELPDLYTRGQIKIFGRYRNAEDLRGIAIALTGSMNEQQQRFDFNGLNFPLENDENEFLAKLWANERVTALLAQIRLYGEKTELKDEVINLAREFNLVTPYTSMYVPTTNEIDAEKASEQTSARANSEVVTVTAAATIANTTANINGKIDTKQLNNLPLNGRNFTSMAALEPGVSVNSKSQSYPLNQNNAYNNLASGPRQNTSEFSIDGARVVNRQYSPAAPGTVTDESGAVVPNATVTLKDENTGATRIVQTDSSGNYSVVGLPPGKYSIGVTAPGFKTTQITDVTIQPGQFTATGVELSAAGASESVNVTNVASSLDSAASQNSSNIEPKKLKDLPTLEPIEKFSLLTPGVTTSSSDGLNRPRFGLSREFDWRLFVNGGRALSNSRTLNGVDNNGLDGQPSILIHNPDAIESLNIMTTRSTGDVGLFGASSINLQTRSGTNYYHGSIFDYYLNRGLGALSTLERRSGLTNQPKYKNSLYGGTLGGPISRDRYFFFGSFQGEKENAQRFFDSTSAYQTPTLQALENLSRSLGNTPTLADLLARNPLIQPISPAASNRTFIRNIQGLDVAFDEITRLIPSSTRSYEANGRFDANLTLRDTVEAEYWFNKRKAANSIGQLVAGFTGDANTDGHLALVRWNRNLSPNSVNEATFSFNRSNLAFLSNGNAANTDASVNLGLYGLSYGHSSFLPSKYNSTLFEFSDTVSRAEGRHNIKLGGQITRRLTNFNELNGIRGQYNFAGFNEFVLNQPLSLAVAVGDARTHFTETHQHYFIDDAWRVKSNLTLSLGLSYENATQPVNSLAEKLLDRESNAATALFDTTLPLELRTLAKVKGDHNNFAPRFGFAYTPRFQLMGWNPFGFDKTIIRGGLSISYDQTSYRPLADIARSSPNVLLAVIAPDKIGSLPTFPQLPDAATLLSLFDKDATKFSRAELAADFRSPYSINWHLTTTRDFNKKTIFEIGYAGSRGIGLTRLLDANALNPDSANAAYSSSRLYASTGRSTYHALQAKIDVQVIDTLVLGTAYTLSKLIDDVPDYRLAIAGINQVPVFGSTPSLAQNPLDVSGGERALSNLDRRHSFNGHFMYTFPRLRGRSGFMAKLTEGWQASGIFELSSGSPYTAIQYFGQSANSTAIYSSMFADRFGSVRPFTSSLSAAPDTVAFSNAANQFYRFFLNADGTPVVSATGFIIANRRNFYAGDVSQARYIYNDYAVEQAARLMGLPADAFGQTYAAGRPFGNEGRNNLISPKLMNVDFAIIKTTKLSEKVSLQFRAESYNLFNHPNRSKPNFILENAGGRGFADLDEVDASPRRIRLALKLIF